VYGQIGEVGQRSRREEIVDEGQRRLEDTGQRDATIPVLESSNAWSA